MSASAFGEVADQFDEHYDEVRGYVRQEVTRANLKQSLRLATAEQMRVLDMEGGAGHDASWLASMGHNIVLMDSSPKQLAMAHEEPELEKASIIQGDIDMALKLYEPTGFDLVLSYGVLLYQENPELYVQKLAKLVRPLGTLSLLTAGKFGKLRRFEQAGDQSAILRLLATGKYKNNLNFQATAHLPQELEDMIAGAGLSVNDWFGVRIKSDDDKRKIKDLPSFHLNRIVRSEINLSRDPQTRPQGQLLHFITRKAA